MQLIEYSIWLVIGMILGSILNTIAYTVPIDVDNVKVLLDKCSTNGGLKEIEVAGHSFTATCTNGAIFITKRN